ncbi:MAG: hypothetical protein LBB63_02765 [Holosporaceae bacterium]|jgi:hypothetical protein|nr:hypothetical protein [Holosporaceae bacterium]
MKIDFRSLEDRHIDVGRFYLYGNNRKTFDVFCDFIWGKMLRKSPGAVRRFCSFGECLELADGQCDLFGSGVDCFFVRNVEDSHLDKLPSLLARKNCVFVMQSGDYAKSKKITDHVLNSADIFAVASFKNDITLHSLCKMLLPNASHGIREQLVRIINETDEELVSLFAKVSLLLDGGGANLQEYVTDKRSFLAQMDFIPLVRYLQQYLLREKISGRRGQLKITSSPEKATSLLLEAEIKQKLGVKIPKNYIHDGLFRGS